jgi:hypothetical protein
MVVWESTSCGSQRDIITFPQDIEELIGERITLNDLRLGEEDELTIEAFNEDPTGIGFWAVVAGSISL